jgi:phage shock protein C
MYCNACGQSIADNARFCSHCGGTVGSFHTGRRMLRSRTNRKIAGVCAGMGQYLDLDVALIRVLTVLITLSVGVVPGLIAYVVAWIIVPEEPETYAAVATTQPAAQS